MKRRIAILLFVLTLLPMAAFAESYSTLLTGAAEVPGPGDADGFGLAVITIDGTTLRHTIWTQNVAAINAAHIHTGAVGVAGGIFIHLDHNNLGNGTVTITTEQANAVRANPAGFYVNVHNADFPGGALRGQLGNPASSGPGAQVQYLTVVGKSRGANNTNFVTDLRVVNDSGATANVTLDYYRASLDGQTAPNATHSFTVAPGEEKVLDDFVGTNLHLDSQVGGLKITSDRNVVVSARILNDQRAVGQGTTGLAITARDEAVTSGTLPFLSQASDADFAAGAGFRTNLGYFNPGTDAVTATFTARRASDGAVLGTSTRTIPGLSMIQQSVYDVISSVPAEQRTQANFYVTWSANAPLLVYAAVVDNKTGDSVFVD